MIYTATFELPDDDDAKWRVLWSADATIESFKKTRYPVKIQYLDENGVNIISFARK